MNNINLEIKKNTYTKIFKIIQKEEPITKKEIEEKTGLSWGTVSQVTNDLINLGYVSNNKEQKEGKGKNPFSLSVSLVNNLTLGIDINISGLTFIVSNLSYKIIEKQFFELSYNEKSYILSNLIDITKRLILKYNSISYISISMQGQVDRKNGISLSVDSFKNWKNVNICKLFEDEFKIKTYIYHDPDCFLNYHLSTNKNLMNLNRCALIKLDEGIGLSIYIDELTNVDDANFTSEIGHNCVNIDGPICRCNKRGCLESYFSIPGLCDRYNEKYKANINSDTFIKLLNKENKEGINILKENAKYLGIGLSNFSNIFNPETIILDGLLAKYYGFYQKELKNTIDNYSKNKVKLMAPDYINEAGALGSSIRTINEHIKEILFK